MNAQRCEWRGWARAGRIRQTTGPGVTWPGAKHHTRTLSRWVISHLGRSGLQLWPSFFPEEMDLQQGSKTKAYFSWHECLGIVITLQKKKKIYFCCRAVTNCKWLALEFLARQHVLITKINELIFSTSAKICRRFGLWKWSTLSKAGSRERKKKKERKKS